MTCEELLKALVGVGLLTDEDAKSVNQRLASTSGKGIEAIDLAGKLVRAGKLTQFQANQVLAGKAKALSLGDYILLDRIGAGGMGQVFQAQHRRMKRIVALKLLPSAALEDAAAVKRFQREVEAAAKLVHPNIVISYDAGQARGQHYLVMEYVNGKDLLYHLKEQGAFSIEQALDYILQAARGLAYAHGEGVVHRDIKPANLLLDGKGTVKILDMGLARIDDAATAQGDGLTQTGQVMGTVDYMAPEQAFDTHGADARADVYSLGCTLYRLLVNENMYGGDSLVKKLIAHREGAIPSLRAKRPDISQPLEAAYQRMVAKQPEGRFQTMAEVIEALEACREPSHAPAGAAGGLTAFSGLRIAPRGGSSGIGGDSKADLGSDAKLQGAAGQGTVGNFNSDSPTDPKNPGLKPQAPASPSDSQSQPFWKRRGVLVVGIAGAALVLLLGVSLIVYLVTRGGTEEVVTAGGGGTDVVTDPADDGTAKTIDDDGKTKPAVTPVTPVEKTTTAHLFTPPAVVPATWHNLLEPVDVTRDSLWGEWLAIVGQGLQANANASNSEVGATKSAMLVLPIAPAAEYQLRLKVKFVGGENRALVLLPVGKRQVAFSVAPPAAGTIRAGFEQLEGKKAGENITATSVVRPALGETHQLDVIVLPRDPEIELYALWDGVPASHWTGTPEKLTAVGNYTIAGEPAIGLICENSLVRFESVELGVLTGDVRYRREDVPQLALNVQPEPMPMPMPTGIIPTATLTPAGIDLIKLVDPAKHSFRGTWKLDGPLLESDQQGNGSGVFFPIYPPAEYRLEVVAERIAGENCLSLGLTSGGSDFGINVDGFDGTTLTLLSVDGKGHAPDNPTYKLHSTFRPAGRIARLRCEVGAGGVRLFEDGALILEWKGDFNRLSLDGYMSHPEAHTLYLMSHNSVYRIYEARLLPLDAPESFTGPDPALITAAVTAVREQFKAELEAAKRPEQLAALGVTLLGAAPAAASDPVHQLALWDESRRLALAGGDITTAMTALDRRHARFPLDYYAEAADAVTLAARKEENPAVVEYAADLMEQAIRADRFDAATKLGAAGMSAARKVGDREQSKRLTDRLAEVKDIQEEYVKLGGAPATLKSNPDDPAANAAVGRFRCFSKGDWEVGLQNLIRGNDAAAKAAALKDMEYPQSAAEQVALGTQWWEIGGKLPRSQRKQAIRRAAEWYLSSLSGLNPMQRATALNRIDEAASSTQPPEPVLPQGLVAYWGFDERSGRLAADSVGKSHALIHGAKWAKGTTGGGLQMTGPNQYVQFPFVGKSDNCTVAMWVNLEPNAAGEIPLFLTQGKQNGAFHFFTDPEGRVAGFVEGRIGTSVAQQVTFRKWSHVAVTCDDGTMVTYVDGAESARNTGGNANAAMMPRIGPGRMGLWYDDSPQRHIRGIIDDVRVYSTTLRPQDVLTLFNATRPK